MNRESEVSRPDIRYEIYKMFENLQEIARKVAQSELPDEDYYKADTLIRHIYINLVELSRVVLSGRELEPGEGLKLFFFIEDDVKEVFHE